MFRKINTICRLRITYRFSLVHLRRRSYLQAIISYHFKQIIFPAKLTYKSLMRLFLVIVLTLDFHRRAVILQKQLNPIQSRGYNRMQVVQHNSMHLVRINICLNNPKPQVCYTGRINRKILWTLPTLLSSIYKIQGMNLCYLNS